MNVFKGYKINQTLNNTLVNTKAIISVNKKLLYCTTIATSCNPADVDTLSSSTNKWEIYKKLVDKPIIFIQNTGIKNINNSNKKHLPISNYPPEILQLEERKDQTKTNFFKKIWYKSKYILKIYLNNGLKYHILNYKKYKFQNKNGNLEELLNNCTKLIEFQSIKYKLERQKNTKTIKNIDCDEYFNEITKDLPVSTRDDFQARYQYLLNYNKVPFFILLAILFEEMTPILLYYSDFLQKKVIPYNCLTPEMWSKQQKINLLNFHDYLGIDLQKKSPLKNYKSIKIAKKEASRTKSGKDFSFKVSEMGLKYLYVDDILMLKELTNGENSAASLEINTQDLIQFCYDRFLYYSNENLLEIARTNPQFLYDRILKYLSFKYDDGALINDKFGLWNVYSGWYFDKNDGR
ncbi:uncharacterized protein SCODWIG_00080 [Saccharomycodes ludwigii]|uniref:Uncharacterized protein n=1 Tax=Saccharomycodes ludwigii TaxID=36035 RepID=A0A376B116_9ASCO|nr:uncharacterized protein SCODWIG_00080 [Saccharomycodes ludwigii]